MKNLVSNINAEYRAGRSSMIDAANHLIRCGQLLAEVKEGLEHGQFVGWVEANCEFKIRAAQRMMAAANASPATLLGEADALKLSRQVWGHEGSPGNIGGVSHEQKAITASSAKQRVEDQRRDPSERDAETAIGLLCALPLGGAEYRQRYDSSIPDEKAAYLIGWLREYLAAGSVVAGLDPEAWSRWVAYRREIKKPLKSASMEAAQRKMATFGPDQAKVVEESIANGYQGLFPGKANGSYQRSSAYEKSDKALREWAESRGINTDEL